MQVNWPLNTANCPLFLLMRLRPMPHFHACNHWQDLVHMYITSFPGPLSPPPQLSNVACGILKQEYLSVCNTEKLREIERACFCFATCNAERGPGPGRGYNYMYIEWRIYTVIASCLDLEAPIHHAWKVPGLIMEAKPVQIWLSQLFTITSWPHNEVSAHSSC